VPLYHSRVLRLCSVSKLNRAEGKDWVFLIARKRCRETQCSLFPTYRRLRSPNQGRVPLMNPPPLATLLSTFFPRYLAVERGVGSSMPLSESVRRTFPSHAISLLRGIAVFVFMAFSFHLLSLILMRHHAAP